jgi:glycosyltransferase involved in cell wall biosynthesis
MALGVPTIVSNVSSLPEVVGDAAIQVDPLDTTSLAGAIESLLGSESRRASFAAAGRERASTFTWARAAEKLRRIYEALS